MDLLSKLIMCKRKRNFSDIIIILRGVPGSGKTTTARQLFDLFKDRYDYYCQIISRDDIRMRIVGHEFNYQASFRDPIVNTKVRDRYFEEMYELLWYYLNNVLVPTVTVIDASNTKLTDLKHTLWTIRHCRHGIKDLHVYVYTKRHEYGSVHQVPECIMERFREELNESDEWLKRHFQEYNLKLVNKVALK